MNILFLTYDFPYPTNSGGKNRAYHMMKYGGSGHTLHLFSFVRSEFQDKYISELREKMPIASITTHLRRRLLDIKNISFLLSSSHSIFFYLYYSQVVSDKLKEIVAREKIDVIHYESYYMGFYLADKLYHDSVKHIFGTENVEYKVYGEFIKERVPSFFRIFVKSALEKIRKEELEFFKKADEVVAVTQDEADLIQEVSGRKSYVVENGIDISEFPFRPKKTSKRNILFVGNFSYFPNREAIVFFYRNVLPKLENVQLTVVGNKATSLPIEKSNILRLIDFVEDIRDVYYDADVFVSPVRFGGGTNFKVLEAMAAGIPVVAFPQRLESLDLKHKEQLLIAEDPEDFAKSIEALLEKKELRDKLIKSARKHIETRFSWQEIGKKLSALWNKYETN